MKELIDAAFAFVNLPFTILLGLVMVYWIIVIIGILDLDFLNIDVEADADVDIDADIPASGGALITALSFLNIGHVPFMIVFSILALCLWVGSILANYYINPSYSIITALVIFMFNMIGAVFITKLITTPLKKFFQGLNQEAKDISLIGKLCTITIEADSQRMGQAEVVVKDAHILVNVKTMDNKTIKKGQRALIFDRSKDESYYLVEPYNDEEILL